MRVTSALWLPLASSWCTSPQVAGPLQAPHMLAGMAWGPSPSLPNSNQQNLNAMVTAGHGKALGEIALDT